MQKFDFSEVKDPGIYYIKYGNVKTNNFLIDKTVYNHITDATTDVWIPIHMNHVTVNEGYRIWHGEPFKEGYLQASPSTDHFDLHSQGPTTDTKYKALELIPGLNVGGYFDAGDFDIETGANINVVQNFVRTWEALQAVTRRNIRQRKTTLRRSPPPGQYSRHYPIHRAWRIEPCGTSREYRAHVTDSFQFRTRQPSPPGRCGIHHRRTPTMTPKLAPL